MEAVRNSDSESDDSGSELEDVDSLLAKFQKGPSAPPKPKPQPRPIQDVTAQTARKSNMAALLAQHDRMKAAEEEEAREDAARIDFSSDDASDDEIDEVKLAVVLKNPELARRTMQGLRKTQALEQEPSFHFFKASPGAKSAVRAFPSSALPKSGWMNTLRQPAQRERLFTSGMALTMARRQPMPPEILEWMLDSACTRSNELLRFRFIEILKESPSQINTLLNTNFIQKRLGSMGACSEVLSTEKPIEMSRQSKKTAELPQKLRWVLEVVRGLASHFPVPSADNAVVLLTRLSLDEQVRHDGHLSSLLHDTVAALIEEGAGANFEQRVVEPVWAVSYYSLTLYTESRYCESPIQYYSGPSSSTPPYPVISSRGSSVP